MLGIFLNIIILCQNLIKISEFFTYIFPKSTKGDSLTILFNMLVFNETCIVEKNEFEIFWHRSVTAAFREISCTTCMNAKYIILPKHRDNTCPQIYINDTRAAFLDFFFLFLFLFCSCIRIYTLFNFKNEYFLALFWGPTSIEFYMSLMNRFYMLKSFLESAELYNDHFLS